MTADSHLQQSVLAELNWDPSVSAGHIGVSVDDGIVTLSGHVESYAEKQAAEAAAHRVKGVLGVAEEIEVQLPDDARRSDEEIAAAAAEHLAWDTRLPRNAVQVEVEDGFVTLTGEVDWHYQKGCAVEDVRRLQGVVGVEDEIAIKPRVNVEGLRDDITHALHRSWFFDSEEVEVEEDEGVVTLTGKVNTPHERQVAAATAWSAPGVSDVRNEIEIDD